MPQAEVQLYCFPSQAPVYTTVRFLDGWSLSDLQAGGDGKCYAADAFNSDGTQNSAVIIQRLPEDCIPVPEPPIYLMMIAAILVVGIIKWMR